MIILGIGAALRKQFIVCSSFFHAVFRDNDNFICIAYGGKTVRNCDTGSVFCQLFQTFLNMPFTFIIQCTCGLIQNQYSWILQEDAGNTDALLLSS